MRIASLSLALLAASVVLAAEPTFKDDFSNPKLTERRASRGDWKFEGGVATCKQDDELYKKYKDHGPIIFYDLPVRDGTVRFSYKPDGCKTVVFTGNGEKGHVFRFISSEAGTSVRAFPGDPKSVQVDQGPALKQGEWIDVVVEWKGPRATIQIGKDFKKTVEHATYDAPKTNLSVGFSFGTLSVKNVSVEKTSR